VSALSYIFSRDEQTENESRINALNDAAELHALLEGVSDIESNDGDGISEQYAEDLIASIRAGRDH
jgi:hypothetical protein